MAVAAAAIGSPAARSTRRKMLAPVALLNSSSAAAVSDKPSTVTVVDLIGISARHS
jgi:hypothetical protein